MISQENQARVIFHYSFRPMLREWRRTPMDDGFAVTLYDNGMLDLYMYQVPRVPCERYSWMMPESLVHELIEAQHRHDYWLHDAMDHIRLQQGRTARFMSVFGFSDRDPVVSEDLPKATQTEIGEEEEGFYARHLLVLFEDEIRVLAKYGLELELDNWHHKEQQRENEADDAAHAAM